MKYNKYDELPFRLPSITKEKSTFVVHNRRSYQDFSLDDLDLSWLDKSKKVKVRKKKKDI